MQGVHKLHKAMRTCHAKDGLDFDGSFEVHQLVLMYIKVSCALYEYIKKFIHFDL